MSSRRMALSVFTAAALAVLTLQSPASAAEVSMLRLVDAPSLKVPEALAASPMVAPVRLNLAALEEPRLSLPLPDGKVLRVQRTDVEQRGRRDYAWRGQTFDAKGQVDGSVTITVWKNLMKARIVTPGKIWNLVPEGGRYWLAQHVAPDLPCGTTGRSEVPLLVKQALAEKADPTPGGFETAPAGAEAAFSRLRLAVVYPRATTLGDTNRLLLDIRSAVDAANTALANGSINARIELVATREVNHTQDKEPERDLEYLLEDPAINALRRQVNASLVSIITASSPVCGIAYLMDEDQYRSTSPTYNVSLVSRSCLDDQTLMHEIGHNLGAHHDVANTSPGEALFPYGYGHFVIPYFSTIMAYSSTCGGSSQCPRIDHFSNPRVTFAGQPVGIPNERDNARLVEQTHFRYAAKTAPGAVCKAGADRLCLLKKRFQVEVVWNNQFNGSSGNGRAVPRTDAAGFFSFGAPVTPLPGREAGCRTSGKDLCLDNRFVVNVDWRNSGNGTQGQAVAVPFSKVTGAFHFGQASNLELMAKVINSGDRIDFFWGALSDLEYTIHVTDTVTGQNKTYQNPGGKYCGGLEVDAF